MKKMGIIVKAMSRVAMVIGWATIVFALAVSTWDEISKYGLIDEDALMLLAMFIGATGMLGEKIEKLGKFMKKNFKIRGHKVKELKTNKEMVA